MEISQVKIYLYTVCYNEQFIIPHFLKHYSYVDKIFVYDNGSTDNSIQLLKNDPRCTIVKFQSDFDDSVNMKIKNTCWKKHRGECDYAIVCDIDEFLWINKNTSIRTLLQTYMDNKKHIDYCPVIGFNMVSQEEINNDELLVEQVKHGLYDKMYNKHNLFNVNTVNDMNFGPGSHTFNIEAFSKNIYVGPKILLLHYKFIGGKSRLQKRYLDFGKRLSQSNKNNNQGLHYLKNPDIEYDELVKNSKKILL